MRTSSEEWIRRLQAFIEQALERGDDPYIISLHIYADFIMQAVAEKQNEIDTLILLKRPANPDS
jgi:hypothetical protein